jgi:hypothetical protein
LPGDRSGRLRGGRLLLALDLALLSAASLSSALSLRECRHGQKEGDRRTDSESCLIIHHV